MKSEASKAKKKAYMKAWREANADLVKQYQRSWREANKDAVTAYQQNYQAAYRLRDDAKHLIWVRSLSKNYKMTPCDFNALWEIQNGECDICKVPMAPKGKAKNSVCVDHNHANGEVRGLLCRACNQGLGHFLDDPETLEKARIYLLERGHYGSNEKTIGDQK